MLFPRALMLSGAINEWALQDKSTAVHEMVHVWDNQNTSVNTWIDASQAQDKALKETGSNVNAYVYGATSLSEFRRANPEARAQQVEDVWRKQNGLEAAFKVNLINFQNLRRDAIPERLLKKEVGNGPN